MEQVYLTDEEFKALPTYAKDQPVPADSPAWKSGSGNGFKTTDGGPWLFCRFGPFLRVEQAQITIVPIAERVRLAVEADRKASESHALAVPQQTALTEIAPKLMGELMERFVKDKNLNQRAQVRMRMKALLDLMGVDTEYPEVPALNQDQDTLPRGRRMRGLPPEQPHFGVGAGYIGVGGGARPVQEVRPDGGADELRRAVEREVQREMGGPRIFPAPGAAAAAPDEMMAEEQGI